MPDELQQNENEKYINWPVFRCFDELVLKVGELELLALRQLGLGEGRPILRKVFLKSVLGHEREHRLNGQVQVGVTRKEKLALDYSAKKK